MLPGTNNPSNLATYEEAASRLLEREKVLLSAETERFEAMEPALVELRERMVRSGVFLPLPGLGRTAWAVDGGLATERRRGNSLGVVAVTAIPAQGTPLGGAEAFLVPHTVGADRVLRAAMAMEELFTAVRLAGGDGWTLLDGSIRSGLVAANQGLNSLTEKDSESLRDILEPRFQPWLDALQDLVGGKPRLAAVPKLTSGFGLASAAGFEMPLSDRAFLSMLMPEGTWTSLARLFAFLGRELPEYRGGERWSFPPGLSLPSSLGRTVSAISRSIETGWVRPFVAGTMAVQVETSGGLEEALDCLTGQFPTSRLQEPLLLVAADQAAKGLCRLIGQAGAPVFSLGGSYRTPI